MIEWHLLGLPKSVTVEKPKRRGIIARLRARKARTDDRVAQGVRIQVASRDGFCRYGFDVQPPYRTACSGVSEWAHYGDQRRFKTRGLPPEERHTTAGSFAMCSGHHADFDAHRLVIAALTERGCDGPLHYQETK